MKTQNIWRTSHKINDLLTIWVQGSFMPIKFLTTLAKNSFGAFPVNGILVAARIDHAAEYYLTHVLNHYDYKK